MACWSISGHIYHIYFPDCPLFLDFVFFIDPPFYIYYFPPVLSAALCVRSSDVIAVVRILFICILDKICDIFHKFVIVFTDLLIIGLYFSGDHFKYWALVITYLYIVSHSTYPEVGDWKRSILYRAYPEVGYFCHFVKFCNYNCTYICFCQIFFFRNFSHIDVCYSCVRQIFWCHRCVRNPFCEHFFDFHVGNIFFIICTDWYFFSHIPFWVTIVQILSLSIILLVS